MAMSNAEIARILSQFAVMLELDGANSFRVRAYREGARVVESLAEPLAALAAEEKGLENIPGIGKSLAQHIRDLLETGTTEQWEVMKKKYPVALVELTELQGIGPKRVRQMFDALGVQDRASLEAAAKAGQLRELPGFGEKMEAKILQSLAVASQFTGRLLLAGAWPVANELADALRALPGVREVEIAGSFRRRKETIGDLDLLVTGGKPEAVMEAFVTRSNVLEVLGQGETKSSVRLASGLQVDLRHVPQESFGAALLYFTGSKAHNIELRKIAIEKGMSLNEYGLTRGERTVAARTEEDIYRALELAWIPPELREMQGEIEMARNGTLPKLIELGDIRGDLHMHSTRSDGQDTLAEMVRASRDRGVEYCAITEHSKALAMIGGFDTARVKQSVAEIAAVRREVPGIEVLHGLEVDILADGALDLSDEGLAILDWVIVSLHSRLDQPGPEVTARVLRALEHPMVHAMGHPTGRQIGSRKGAALDMERVFERAAALGVAMEINAQPDRTDLSDVNARFAREKGVRLVIDTDAHSIRQLDFMRYGVFAARRAGLTKEHVLNTLPIERLRAALRPRDAAKKAASGATAAAPPATAKKPASGANAALRATAKKPTSGANAARRATPATAGAARPAAKSAPRPRRSR
jgi:DNA polymerase (family 10)